MRDIRCLTIWQPWAWATVHKGPLPMSSPALPGAEPKSVENRTWPAPPKLRGRWIGIHAGTTFDSAGLAHMGQCGIVVPPSLVRGAVVGLRRLLGSTQRLDGNRWFFGPYGWMWGDLIRLEHPIACRGKQGLWKPSPSVREVLDLAIERHLSEAA